MHGTFFLYNNWDFNVTGTIFEQLTGKSIYASFTERLATPLQLEDYDPNQHKKIGNAKRSIHLAYPFYLSTRDMARIGQLLLNGGSWNGQSLISKNWISEMTLPRTRSGEMHPERAAARGLSYGYMWWIPEEADTSPLHGAYMAWGVHGQYILVVPKADMVIAHKRRVPEANNWNVSWVGHRQFLKAATLLARSRCES
jgi:CubicO group peptidase (beta-lactamase class C family)